MEDGASAFRRPSDLHLPCTNLSLLRAVQMWLAGEDVKLIARKLGIHYKDVAEYTTLPGWRFIEDCVRDDVRRITLSGLSRLTHRCFTLLHERLDKGDPIYGPDGETIGYRAVKAKDLGTIINQLMSQQATIEERGQPRNTETDIDLVELAESLKNYALEKQFRKAKVIEQESTN